MTRTELRRAAEQARVQQKLAKVILKAIKAEGEVQMSPTQDALRDMDAALKVSIAEYDARIVARGGMSIFAPRCEGKGPEWFTPDAFIDWEHERLTYGGPKPDPDDGFYRRLSSRGKLHLVRKT